MIKNKKNSGELPGSPVVKTQRFHCCTAKKKKNKRMNGKLNICHCAFLG